MLAEAGDAAAIEAAAAWLYGRPPGPLRGVLHVAAVAARPGGLAVLRIRPETPRSVWDGFALNLARARAGAIVVTGQILREEPELRYVLQGPGRLPEGLAAWRRERAGLAAPPLLLVLTGGRDLDFAHPAFGGWARPVVFTGAGAAGALSPPAGVEVVGHGAPSLRAAIRWLGERGVRGISVEAGPSTASDLYAPPVLADELALTIYQGPLAPGLVGGALPDEATLAELLPRGGAGRTVSEPSGAWRFVRRWRPPAR